MAEVINTNVFNADKKFVDFSGLDYFWGKAKTYIDGVDASMSAKVVALENAVGDSTKGLVKDLADLTAVVDGLGQIEGGEGIGGMIDAKIASLKLSETYDAKGAADAALDDAKDYVDGKVDGKFDTVGSASAAETAAKAYADGLVMADGVAKFDAAGSAATAKSEAIAQAQTDTTTALGNYYTKAEVDAMWAWEEFE